MEVVQLYEVGVLEIGIKICRDRHLRVPAESPGYFKCHSLGKNIHRRGSIFEIDAGIKIRAAAKIVVAWQSQQDCLAYTGLNLQRLFEEHHVGGLLRVC